VVLSAVRRVIAFIRDVPLAYCFGSTTAGCLEKVNSVRV
jgi:hypothetical protein